MLTQYQPNKYAISRQKATVIKIVVLTHCIVPDKPWAETLEFISRYCVAFRTRKKQLYIGSLLKAGVRQVRHLAKVSECTDKVLPIYWKCKHLNMHLICPVCLFGFVSLNGPPSVFLDSLWESFQKFWSWQRCHSHTVFPKWPLVDSEC